jgi:hypothetical protein
VDDLPTGGSTIDERRTTNCWRQAAELLFLVVRGQEDLAVAGDMAMGSFRRPTPINKVNHQCGR